MKLWSGVGLTAAGTAALHATNTTVISARVLGRRITAARMRMSRAEIPSTIALDNTPRAP